MRTWTRLVLAVLLATPFTGSSLRADAETNDKKIEKLQTDVAQLRKDMESLRNEVRDSSARGARTATDIQDIKDLLRTLAKQQDTLRRESGYDPRSVTPGIPGGVLPTMGTVTLENVYSAPATVRINGQSYRVDPGQVLPITVPLGTFQYSVEVDGNGLTKPLSTETLRPAGYRIRIYPRIPLISL